MDARCYYTVRTTCMHRARVYVLHTCTTCALHSTYVLHAMYCMHVVPHAACTRTQDVLHARTHVHVGHALRTHYVPLGHVHMDSTCIGHDCVMYVLHTT